MSELFDKFGQPIFEMANIIPSVHKLGIDIKFHVQQPGDKLPPHYVNTKVFRGDFKTTDKKFTVSIPSLEITDGDDSWLSNKEKKIVREFIRLNKDNFMKLFSDQGLSPDELIWNIP